MNLVMGMIVRNEAEMLAKTLPVTRGVPTLKIALDFGSTDATHDILIAHDWKVYPSTWVNDYSVARNDLLSLGRVLSCPTQTWMLQLDADECMWPEDVDKVDAATRDARVDLLALPRYNLAGRGTLHATDNYPDSQTRVVRLSSAARYRLPVHEVIDGPRDMVDAHIYHFGWCKSPRQNWLRSHNYSQISKGLDVLEEAPNWVSDEYSTWLCDMAMRHTFERFDKPHPLIGKL